MNLIGNVIRPPGEAYSFIVQATLGCSSNTCLFCPAYKKKPYLVRQLSDIKKDIDKGGMYNRLFIADGDAFGIGYENLSAICEYAGNVMPELSRIGIYARADNILKYSAEELAKLKRLKLGIVYIGLESGSEKVLEYMKKNNTADDNIAASRLLKKAGIKQVVTILLGAGGVRNSLEHAQKTAEVLNKMQPEQIAALTMMVVPAAPLHAIMKRGDFTLPDSYGMLRELRVIIENLSLRKTLFLCNHASNYLPLRLKMPKDKESALMLIDAALNGTIQLMHEKSRGL